MRSGWAWARAFPRRSLALVSRLWRTERRGAVLGLLVVLAAALVLALRSPAHRGAALKQGSLPAIAVVCLALGALLG